MNAKEMVKAKKFLKVKGGHKRMDDEDKENADYVLMIVDASEDIFKVLEDNGEGSERRELKVPLSKAREEIKQLESDVELARESATEEGKLKRRKNKLVENKQNY
ncbi:hypothetical protein Tco_0363914 [Tanacetum coccineum]